ncbi:MAG: aldose 1-epimerase [Caulobacteraceae bacterium]|nr:aldose 1-epimerase [Caulobacteraceae bacterium]
MSARIALARDGWTAEVGPAMGGSILSLARAGEAILRPTPQAAIEAGEVRASACYPLVPYANRIADGRFSFTGAEHRLAANFPGSAHTLHGVGWLRPWRVEAADAVSCTLALEHRVIRGRAGGNEPQDWPFAFDARQHLALGPEGLTVSLSVTNADDMAAPAGLGLHPFFPRRPGQRLRFASRGAWRNGPDMLPAGRVAGGAWDHAGDPAVDAAELDNDFFGWDGLATLSAPQGPRAQVRASGAFGVLRVYTPAGRDFLAVEPVTHRADAINHPGDADGAMTVLAPGETLRGEVQFGVESGS